VGHVGRMAIGEVHTGFWLGTPERKRRLGKPRRRWKDNTEMELQELGWGIDWIDLGRDRDR
jgi:hypothetical protein